MSLLIYAGLLYLLGVSIVLTLKPEVMFTKDGNWKEFGLGRPKHRYTWIPFWLFAILWAILSYLIVLVVAGNTGSIKPNTKVNVENDTIEPENVSMKAMSPNLPHNVPKKRPSSMEEMKKGYYILDTNETLKKGIPKYIYLGPEAPNLVYHHDMEGSPVDD